MISHRVVSVLGYLCVSVGFAWAQPEILEIGPYQTDQLPGGKEADGIIGDFVMRNDLIEAVVSHRAPNRRANMSTFYGEDGITPGSLYDLTLRGVDNDQLTIIAPLDQRGDVSYVRIAQEGEEAIIETVVSSAINAGIYKRHAYHLRDGWQGLLVTSEVRNETDKDHTFKAIDTWSKFHENGSFEGIRWADAVDPADKAGYASCWVQRGGSVIPGKEVILKPGEEIRLARFVAVGHSPAEAVGIAAVQRHNTLTYPFKHQLQDRQGKPITTASLSLLYQVGDKTHRLKAYPDETGLVGFPMIQGGDWATEIRDFGRETVTFRSGTGSVSNSDPREPVSSTMSDATAVCFNVRDDLGKSLPCKVQFLGVGDTPSPNFGPNNRAHGCLDQYQSETGQFTVQVDPGTYTIVVTHGIEFGHVSREVTLGKGKVLPFDSTLKRLVDTTGWVSADFHNHATPSGDNTCGIDDRVINIAAEQIEFAPTTEHNRIDDWRPHINRLGLKEEIQTVVGLELTGSGAHFNVFPLTAKPFHQDGGAPVWQKDPRLNAIILRDYPDKDPDRWIQINHPDMVENFIDRDGDGRADGGYLALGRLIDGIETQNYLGGELLLGAPYKIVKDPKVIARQIRYVREFIWLQLLNQGHKIWGVCVADAHTVHGNGVGSWRNYLPSSTDKPAEIDWREMVRHAKAGRMIVTSGPFLKVETEDGTIAGGSTRASNEIELNVSVQCTDWIDIDRVQVLVNGAPLKSLNFTRATHPDWFREGVLVFDQTILVPLSQDSHLIVVAYGSESTLEVGYGSSTQAAMHPCAYNNPIFVDVDGGGFQPNYDTLGFPLPVQRMTVGEVEGHLARPKQGLSLIND